MYEEFFGLKTLPFKITPDPAFIYWDAAHRRAASVLAFGIEQLVPITVVTGDVGTGKTTLLQHFLEDAPREMTVGMISNFWSGMGGLHQWILNAFDIRAEGSSVQLHRAFEDFVISEYAAGRRCVLIVDEAQNVSDEDLEQLRMLTNINARKDCLLMLFLVGQPELRDRLHKPNNRQIAQRVGASFHLGPLSLEDTGHYIRHRIGIAGGTREIFDSGAIESIYRLTDGVPRLINVVSELALVTAFGDGVEMIDAAYMEEFLAEAAETGLIAHLPHAPSIPDREPSAPKPIPGKPGSSNAPAFHNSGSLGNRKPSIRLVSEPWEAEGSELPGTEPQEPAAKSTDPTEIAAPKTEQKPPPEEPETESLSEDGALELPSPEIEQVPQTAAVAEVTEADQEAEIPVEVEAAPEQEPEHEPEPEPETATDADLVAALRREPKARTRQVGVLQGLVARVLDDGINIALVALMIVAVYATIRSFGDETALEVPRVDAAATEPAQVPEAVRAPAGTSDEPEEAQPVVTALPSDGTSTQATPAVGAPEQPATPEEPDRAEAAPEPEPEPEPTMVLDDQRGDVLLEYALTSGVSDPIGAAIAYSRAALRGEDRAAYYLGQLFETGVGVPQDLAAARAWYQRAEANVRSAKRRLADLKAPDSSGTLATPIPLLGGQLPGGTAEFVWSPGVGADAKLYILELAKEPDGPTVRLDAGSLTAISVPDIGAARIWRVLALNPTTSEYAVSDWRGMGSSTELVLMAGGPVRTEISLRAAEGTSRDMIDVVADVLAQAGIAVALDERPAVDAPETTVSYAYNADQSAAQRVAGLLGDGVQVIQVPADSSGKALMLPGELTVVLN